MPTFDRAPQTLMSNLAVSGQPVTVKAGTYIFAVDGTFNGATIKLQLKSPAGNLQDIGNEATLTAAGQCVVDLPDGTVQATVSGGPPAAMFATLSPVRA